MHDKLTRKKLQYVEGISSIIINVGLFIVKFMVGTMSGSIAIIADAWHTLSDSLTSLVVIIAAGTAHKPADTEHPFGHGRIELIASLIIGVFLAMVGVNFCIEGIEKLLNREGSVFALPVIPVLIVSVVLKELSAQFAFWGARKTGSRTLHADGWHHRSDAITSLIILAAVYFGKAIWWIDSAMAIVVAFVILKATWDIMKDPMNILIGRKPDENFIETARAITTEITGNDSNIHHLHVHSYGDHREVTFHINLPGSMKLKKAHEIATAIENTIRQRLHVEATIHVEPEIDEYKSLK